MDGERETVHVLNPHVDAVNTLGIQHLDGAVVRVFCADVQKCRLTFVLTFVFEQNLVVQVLSLDRHTTERVEFDLCESSDYLAVL